MDTENINTQNESVNEPITDGDNETPLFESTYVLTEEEYKKLIFAVRPWIKLIIIWVAIIAITCYSTFVDNRSDDSMLIYLITTIILLPLLLFLSYRRGLMNFRQDKSLNNSETHQKFYKSKLVVETARGNRITPYNEIYKIKEKKEYIFLYISKHRFLPVIKKYCSNELIEFIKNIKH